MFISHTPWQFIEKRADIKRLMQSTISSSSPIQHLNVEFVKIYDVNNVKLTLNIFVHETVFSYLSLSNVEHVYYELNQYTMLIRNSNILCHF